MQELPSFVFSPTFVFLVALGYVLKGFALWRAAKLGQRVWFVALLIVQTFGILEVIYLFLVSKRTSDDSASTSNL